MDTETLFQKFRQVSRLMKPRGRRGGPFPGGPGRGFGPGRDGQPDATGHVSAEGHDASHHDSGHPGTGFPGGQHPGGWHNAADPTRGQGRILAALKLQDGVPTKDLAYILGMRVASLNELLGKLERADLITREPSEADKRVSLIRLTEEGRNTEQFKPQRPDAFSTLTDEEQEQLGAFLDRIIEHLESQLSESEDAPDEDFERWSEQARARMGDENFERWMSRMSRMSEYGPEGYGWMRSGRFGGPGRGEHHGHGGHGGHGRGGRGGRDGGRGGQQGDFREHHEHNWGVGRGAGRRGRFGGHDNCDSHRG